MKKVVKFGGSSLASAEQFKKVGKIIKADEDRRYVVPSAPGKRYAADTKVTDMLYACYALAEAEIYENFSSLVEGKTAVYISHRLASTRFCDKIALFDADGLAEYGSHEELMEQKGKYYEMFMIQGKYYQDEHAQKEAAAGKEVA